jgi:hypothetical protein
MEKEQKKMKEEVWKKWKLRDSGRSIWRKRLK